MGLPAEKFPIAIDLSDDEYYALQLSRRDGDTVVSGLATHAPDEQPAEGGDAGKAATAFVRTVLSSSAFRGRSVVMLLPLNTVFSFPIRVQPGKEENLEQAIVREAAKALPFPLEEAVLDYPSIDDAAGTGTRRARSVVITAVRRADIAGYLAMVGDSGGVLEAVDYCVSALLRVHAQVRAPADGMQMICSVGRSRTVLSAVTRDSIVAHRNVDWGVQNLVERLQNRLDLADGKQTALYLLRRHGLAFHNERGAGGEQGEETEIGRAVAQLVSPLADELVHHVHNLSGYVRSERQGATFQTTCLYGYGAGIRHLDRYLEQETGIATKPFDPLLSFPLMRPGLIPDPDWCAPFAPVLGLAMRRVQWL